MNEKWLESTIKDDPVIGSNTRGTISYATDGPDTRSTQVTALLKMTGETPDVRSVKRRREERKKKK